MAGAEVYGRLNWLVADVLRLIPETPRVKSIVVNCPGWPGHRAGQHVDIRLTAEDGYQAERSYSLATPIHGEELQLTVERLPDGEVSPYLCDELRTGDRFELRGPIGGYFVWEPGYLSPLLLIAGGSGIVPLMAILRLRAESGSRVPVRLLYSSRSADEIIYRPEPDTIGRLPGVQVVHTLTRSQPPGWLGFMRRVDAEMLADVAWPPTERPLSYVCGPTPFVERVAGTLVDLGHRPDDVKTERFGPTGLPG